MKAHDMLQAARLLRLAVAMALAILLQAISPQGLALAYSATDEWLVYWYLCGSDLVSDPDGTIYSVDAETFKAGKHLIMSDEETGDGFYAYFFEFVSPNNETALSNLVEFTIKNGEITTTAHN